MAIQKLMILMMLMMVIDMIPALAVNSTEVNPVPKIIVADVTSTSATIVITNPGSGITLNEIITEKQTIGPYVNIDDSCHGNEVFICKFNGLVGSKTYEICVKFDLQEKCEQFDTKQGIFPAVICVMSVLLVGATIGIIYSLWRKCHAPTPAPTPESPRPLTRPPPPSYDEVQDEPPSYDSLFQTTHL